MLDHSLRIQSITVRKAQQEECEAAATAVPSVRKLKSLPLAHLLYSGMDPSHSSGGESFHLT